MLRALSRSCRPISTTSFARSYSMSAPNPTPIASSSSSTISESAPVDAPLLPTSPESALNESLDTASSLLHQDLPVAFPTETVYGLGASALSSVAVKRIFAAKGRPSDNPLIVHVSSREMLFDLLPTNSKDGHPVIPKMYQALMDRFWPGPLSLIFPLDLKGKGKAAEVDTTTSTEVRNPPRRAVAPEVTAGQPSLCVRMPSHPLALSLIRHADLPLAAPSANLSSRPSPTTAAHVVEDLGHGRGLGAILDGGSCQVGVESTVVDWVAPADGAQGEGELRVLRAGGVSAEEIEACLRAAGFGAAAEGPAESGAPNRIRVYARDFRSEDLEERPTTPGMKYKHYAPGNAKVVLVKPVAGASADGPLPSLQDLVQLTALTHAPADVAADDGDDSDTTSHYPRFRVGLMLTYTTLSALGATSLSAVSPPCELVRLPPAPPSPFANLADDEESNLPDLDEIDVLSYPLGSRERPLEAAQRLFAGLRFLDHYVPKDDTSGKVGVDLIFVEAVPEEGVGLAVMERARKAAGGQPGEMEFQL